MKRGYLLIASSVLAACICMSAQNSSPDSNSSSASANSGHGIYVSGFEILDGARGLKQIGELEQYAHQVLFQVRQKWYPQLLELQKSMERKRGIAVIDFEINMDGSAGNVAKVVSAGDPSLDAAASLAILKSAPFAHLPATDLQSLKLRMHFGYDQPASATAPFCDGPNWGAHPTSYALHQMNEGLTPPKATYSPDPEYSEKARKEKYMSTVWVAGTVDPDGAFADLCLSQAGGEGLDEKAMEAFRTWRFQPATLHGQAVAVRINVEATFHLY